MQVDSAGAQQPTADVSASAQSLFIQRDLFAKVKKGDIEGVVQMI